MKIPQSIAGMMGKQAAQPAQMKMMQTVDPLERLQQRMAGKTLGGAINGFRKKDKTSLISMYRMR